MQTNTNSYNQNQILTTSTATTTARNEGEEKRRVKIHRIDLYKPKHAGIDSIRPENSIYSETPSFRPERQAAFNGAQIKNQGSNIYYIFVSDPDS